MKKPNGFDEAQAIRGEFKALPAGGYVCKVVNVALTKSKSGKEMLQIGLDIADGDYKDYYRKQFAARYSKDNNAKWGCTYYQLTEGDSMGRFKGMLMNFEESNKGYKWNWDETTLVDKLIGGKFGEEEYRNQQGQIRTVTRCVSLLPVEGITEIEAPEKKTLNDNPQGNAAGTAWGYEMPASHASEIPF